MDRLVQEKLPNQRFGFSELKNPSVAGQLPTPSIYCSFTRSHCDCDTAIGAGNAAHSPRPPSKQLKKLRARGWSEAKIERWLREKEKNSQRKQEATRSGHQREIEQWWLLITEALRSGLTQHLGLLKHWYKTDVFTESLDFAVERMAVNDHAASCLLELQDDVLYLFE